LSSGNFNIEKELLAQVANGDEESFKSLFHAYNKKLFNYISTIIKSRQVAEEIVMDVFLKIWLGKEIITQIENFDSFLFRVAHNKSIDFLRSAARDPKLKDLLWDEIQLSGSDQTDTLVLKKEFETKLREAVSLLSAQRRKAWQLSRNEEMTHEQIALHLGLSKNTVNNHIVEAQKFIRSYLAQKLDIAYFLILFHSRWDFI
jgi:RNA polymerase sigma-70 factor (ECF subfamily)